VSTRITSSFSALLCSVILLPLFALSSSGQTTPPFDSLEWRSIGPAIFAGRVADVEGIPGDPKVVYVASASGGLWKTVNGGISWRPIFERQGTLSLGDIAIDPRNPEVIWAGTGEGNPRNSVSFGDGVYKSTDGGETWQHLGLRETMSITRILIHPQNSNIVFVGALGHTFGPNEDRGVFMTTDGGKSWQKTLYLDPEHGVADMDIDPVNPNIVYAAMWRFERKPWTFTSGSEKGGVYKSTDGGLTWKRLTKGLPKMMGRIGVKVAPSNPQVVYVIAETKEGILFRSADKGESFTTVSRQANIVSRGFYYTDLRVDPKNEDRMYAISSPLFVSIDGGRTHRTIAPKVHIDYHAMWIDPLNPERIWVGNDGGVAVSYDQGTSWENVNNLPIGQPYHVYADQRQPFYWVMGGMQDNGSWTGPSRTREPDGILNDDWRMVSFGDGFKVINHPDDPEVYLSLSQGGNLMRTDMRTREQQFVKPWVAGQGGAASNQKYRFHWNAPLVFSPHQRTTVYLGGNVLFKSADFGMTWTRISDDLTTNDPEKLKDAGGPIATENTTAEYHCTIISVAESPLQAGVIWAGTDDGRLQRTTDGGKSWINLSPRIADLPAISAVSHIEPSAASAETTYVAFDRHLLDDFQPYVYRTTDGGRTFSRISGNLPSKAYVHSLKEDPRNPNLLYAGTELGLFATYDGGRTWLELGMKNLPRVAVHDILVHPRENDLILATHGRSFWIFDDATVLQRTTAELLDRKAYLFEPRPALRFTMRFTRYGMGDKPFAGPNPPTGALLTYYLRETPASDLPVKLQILDAKGQVLRELTQLPRNAGLHRVTWDLGLEAAPPRRPLTAEQIAQMQMMGISQRGTLVLPGVYTVRLVVGETQEERQLEVRIDPTVTVSTGALTEQFELSQRLQQALSSLNGRLRTLDGIREQMQQLERTLRLRTATAPAESTKLLKETLAEVDRLLEELATPTADGLGYRGTSRITNQISSLFSSIQGVHAAPTPAQKEFAGELLPEATAKVELVDRFLSEQMKKFNERFRQWQLPTILF
jgi:photosystem II stability/assembly factor-like uncharacterized protein